MAQVEMVMPKMGESVAEATIIKWLKNEGDRIEAEESILEIATDKVDSEVPAPVAGIISKQLFPEGETIKVGSVIAVIETEQETETNTIPKVPLGNENGYQPDIVAPSPVQVSSSKPLKVSVSGEEKHSLSGKFFSPLVRNIAKKESVSVEELETIQGSGANGRITKKDILAYLPFRQLPQTPTPQISPAISSQTATASKPSVSINAGDEIIEMDRMRKLIADHMVMSKHTSPHVTSFVETDVTNIVMWRERIKKEFEQREREKITYTPVFIEAIVKTIKDFPLVNIAVDGSKIIKRNDINIGIATALPSGNLIVPVIKKADQMSLLGLTKSVNDLVVRARINKLQPDEIQGGTFTLSNVGTFGNVMGTPIINQPQVAIMATGIIKKKPVVIETSQGDLIGIRHMMFLSMSYDHRVVDGALGGSFLRKVADYLEQFDVNRAI